MNLSHSVKGQKKRCVNCFANLDLESTVSCDKCFNWSHLKCTRKINTRDKGCKWFCVICDGTVKERKAAKQKLLAEIQRAKTATLENKPSVEAGFCASSPACINSSCKVENSGYDSGEQYLNDINLGIRPARFNGGVSNFLRNKFSGSDVSFENSDVDENSDAVQNENGFEYPQIGPGNRNVEFPENTRSPFSGVASRNSPALADVIDKGSESLIKQSNKLYSEAKAELLESRNIVFARNTRHIYPVIIGSEHEAFTHLVDDEDPNLNKKLFETNPKVKAVESCTSVSTPEVIYLTDDETENISEGRKKKNCDIRNNEENCSLLKSLEMNSAVLSNNNNKSLNAGASMPRITNYFNGKGSFDVENTIRRLFSENQEGNPNQSTRNHSSYDFINEISNNLNSASPAQLNINPNNVVTPINVVKSDTLFSKNIVNPSYSKGMKSVETTSQCSFTDKRDFVDSSRLNESEAFSNSDFENRGCEMSKNMDSLFPLEYTSDSVSVNSIFIKLEPENEDFDFVETPLDTISSQKNISPFSQMENNISNHYLPDFEVEGPSTIVLIDGTPCLESEGSLTTDGQLPTTNLCEICGKTFRIYLDSPQWANHICENSKRIIDDDFNDVETTTPMLCEVCGKSSTALSHFLSHRKLFHEHLFMPVLGCGPHCELCGVKFRTDTHLKLHKIYFHQIINSPTISSEVSQTKNLKNVSKSKKKEMAKVLKNSDKAPDYWNKLVSSLNNAKTKAVSKASNKISAKIDEINSKNGDIGSKYDKITYKNDSLFENVFNGVNNALQHFYENSKCVQASKNTEKKIECSTNLLLPHLRTDSSSRQDGSQSSVVDKHENQICKKENLVLFSQMSSSKKIDDEKESIDEKIICNNSSDSFSENSSGQARTCTCKYCADYICVKSESNMALRIAIPKINISEPNMALQNVTSKINTNYSKRKSSMTSQIVIPKMNTSDAKSESNMASRVVVPKNNTNDSKSESNMTLRIVIPEIQSNDSKGKELDQVQFVREITGLEKASQQIRKCLWKNQVNLRLKRSLEMPENLSFAKIDDSNSHNNESQKLSNASDNAEQEMTFSCLFCGVEFDTKKKLLSHSRSIHYKVIRSHSSAQNSIKFKSILNSNDETLK